MCTFVQENAAMLYTNVHKKLYLNSAHLTFRTTFYTPLGGGVFVVWCTLEDPPTS